MQFDPADISVAGFSGVKASSPLAMRVLIIDDNPLDRVEAKGTLSTPKGSAASLRRRARLGHGPEKWRLKVLSTEGSMCLCKQDAI